MSNNSENRKHKVNSRVLSFGFITVVAIGLLIYLFASGDASYIGNAFVRPRALWLVFGALLIVASWFLEAFILQYMSKGQAHPMRYMVALRSTMVVQFFNNVTPFASGGQPMQIWSLWRDGIPVGESTSIQIGKFAIYQSVLTLTSLLSILIAFDTLKEQIGAWTSIIVIGFIVNISVLLFVVMLIVKPKAMRGIIRIIRKLVAHTRLRERTAPLFQKADVELDHFEIASSSLVARPRVILISALLTFFQLVLAFMAPFCVMNALGMHPGFIFSLAGASFILMVSGVVPLPGASGGAEAAFALVFGSYFNEAGVAVMAAVVLWRAMTYYLPILVGAPFCVGAPKDKDGNTTTAENETP